MKAHALDRSVDADTLMASGMALAADHRTAGNALHMFVDQLIELGSRSSTSLDGRCFAYADTVLADTFERGWQPAELIHVIKRRMDKPDVSMIKAMMGAHTRRTRALSTAPQDWRNQLSILGIEPGSDLSHYRRASTIDPHTFWVSLFRLLVDLRFVPSMTPVVPVPSRWNETASTNDTANPSRRSDTKVLNTIRGLLAKAESSTFAAEAETFSAKAQELMTRYAIDSAVVDADDGTVLDSMVVTRRLVVDNPYADAKMDLLSGVAASNGARTVWYKKLGLISITGMPVDLDLCELLYTSLLVQSARAVDRAGSDARTRSRGFRRAFLLGYSGRIRERLAEARVRADRSAGAAYGSALVPIMAERDRAVTSMFEDLFPDLRSVKITFSDRFGAQQGRSAAERADLTGGREQVDR